MPSKVAKQIEAPRPPDPIMRRPRADREEKRATYGRDMSGNPVAMRYVTKAKAMPTGRKPDGEQAMTNAERQARYRARHAMEPATAPITRRLRRPADRRSRPQRWREAVAELLALQADYADWLAALPETLHGSPTAKALEAVLDLDPPPWPTSTRRADTDGTEKAIMDGEKSLAPNNPNQKRLLETASQYAHLINQNYNLGS